MLTPRETTVERVRCTEGEKGLYCEVVYWAPLVNEPPIFWSSTEKVLCFSKTPGGAVIGSVTGEDEFKGGRRCICVTSDTPTIDISDELVGDFQILQEVRYRNPVNTKTFGEFTVDDALLKEIATAYQTPWGFPNLTRLKRIRSRINREVKVV